MNDDFSELFWNASIDEMKQGYLYYEPTEEFVCLICGHRFAKGVIFPFNGVLYEAETYSKVHLANEHESMFHHLLHLNKKLTGLTDLQKNLIQLFYDGFSDQEIVKKLDGGSTSTIRNHRFSLREKEKQAKIFLAIMGLLEQKSQKKQKFIHVPRSATMLDDRYAITEEENEEIIRAYFADGRLTDFPKKEKKKVAILKYILRRFDVDRTYSEKEINDELKLVYDDYVTLRRYLIEYGFMDRFDDGSKYWVKV